MGTKYLFKDIFLRFENVWSLIKQVWVIFTHLMLWVALAGHKFGFCFVALRGLNWDQASEILTYSYFKYYFKNNLYTNFNSENAIWYGNQNNKKNLLSLQLEATWLNIFVFFH